MNQKKHRIAESGNVLFLILIAVVLFGALSFTVSNMMNRGNVEIISEEKAKLYSNEILDYARSISLAIKHMRITNECSDTEINFENSTIAGYTNGTAPSDNSCDVFNVDGGAMLYIVPSDDWMDASFSAQSMYKEWYFTGHTCIEDMGGSETNCHTDGLDNSDLMLFLPYIKKAICQEINNNLAIAVDTDDVWSVAETKFTGTYGETGDRNDGGTAAYPVGCFQSTGSNPANGSYTMYLTLIPRAR